MRHDAELLNLQPASPSETPFQPVRSQQPDSQPPSPDMQPPLADQVLSIHEYERRRIGQELHDSAGQLLVSLQLSVARLGLSKENCGHENLIGEIQDTVRQIDREIRALAFLHYPAELGDRSLSEAVQALVSGFGKRTGIETTFRCFGRGAVAKTISVAVLRVIQEALVNVHRHAHASHAKVMLASNLDGVRLTVSDDGIGIRAGAESDRGIGLQGMRHRVEKHGGNFHVRRLGHGTRVSATLPLVA
jgi:two-component system, NarL family, sensor kinase